VASQQSSRATEKKGGGGSVKPIGGNKGSCSTLATQEEGKRCQGIKGGNGPFWEKEGNSGKGKLLLGKRKKKIKPQKNKNRKWGNENLTRVDS